MKPKFCVLCDGEIPKNHVAYIKGETVCQRCYSRIKFGAVKINRDKLNQKLEVII